LINAQTIEGFVKKLLLKNFDDAQEIPDCHREWWEACCSTNKFVAIAAPRGFAKSTAITHAYTLAKLLFRESKYAIIVSDSETQASLFLGDIKKEIADNEDLRELFGIKGFSKETDTDIIVDFLDGQSFRVMAKGSEQKLRGLKWGNKRPDLIVCDDMENDELVMNKERREKLKKWFSSALLPVRSDRGIIRMVGTILHADSLLEGFMPKQYDPYTVERGLKVWSTITSGWLSIKYRAHNKDFTQLLWEQKKDKAELLRIRQMYKDQGLLDIYSQEYLNNPIDESNTYFRRSDLLEEREEDREKPLTYYITMDLAVTQKTSSDYSVFLVAGIDAEGFVYVRHIIRERMDAWEIGETLFGLVRAYDPAMVVSEKGLIINSIMPTLKKKMEEENLYFPFELIASTVDKVQRAQAIRLRARAGKVKVNKAADWWPVFEDEVIGFPRAPHDDVVDAFALVGQALNKFFEAPTVKDLEDEEWEEAMEEGGYFNQGRNQITGY
jgi:predicted phage terminase large subunit-like protein